MTWTRERMEKLSHQELHNLWVNASARGVAEVTEAIKASGLPYGNPKGFVLESPVGRKMQSVVFSEESKALGVQSVDQKVPALGLIEPLIVEALGQEYTAARGAAVQAGYMVTNMMEAEGFVQTKKKKMSMPEGSIAKTAEVFARKKAVAK